MASIIKVKRGSGVPASGVLAGYELGWDYTNDALYLGVDGNNPIKLADSFGEFLSINKATGLVTATNNVAVGGLMSSDTLNVSGAVIDTNGNITIPTGSTITLANGDTVEEYTDKSGSGLVVLDTLIIDNIISFARQKENNKEQVKVCRTFTHNSITYNAGHYALDGSSKKETAQEDWNNVLTLNYGVPQ